MKKTNIIVAVLVLLLSCLAYAQGYSIRDNLEVGQTKTYTLGGNDYEVVPILVSGSSFAETIVFSINGQINFNLTEGQSFYLPGGIEVSIIDITPVSSSNSVKTLVEFKFGSIQDTLEVETSKTYTLNGLTYSLSIALPGITPATKFNVNGEVTNSLKIKDNYTLADSTILTIYNIISTQSGNTVQSTVDFGLKKEDTSVPSCTDSDGGKSYYTYGYIKGSIVGYDSCTDGTTYGIGSYVSESYCDNGQGKFEVFKCPNGCKNGACITSNLSCVDSDGGINYYTKGTAQGYPDTVQGGEYDACTDSMVDGSAALYSGKYLHESYCSGNYPKSTMYACPNGCKDGVCIKSTQCYSNADCPKSEPVSYCSGNSACTSSKISSCINGQCVVSGGGSGCTVCPNGCSNGACINTVSHSISSFWTDKKKYTDESMVKISLKAIDSDGTTFTPQEGARVKLYITSPASNANNWNQEMSYNSYSRYYEFNPLVDSNTLKGSYIAYAVLNFNGGSVVSSKIFFTIGSNNPVGCTDSDGGKSYYVFGTAVDPKFPEGLSDYCADNYNLNEYLCSYFTNFADGSPDGYYATTVSYNCPGGCSNGACIMTQQYNDLSSYPKMFFDNGKLNAILVVGDKAPAQDVIAVTDIAMSLKQTSEDMYGNVPIEPYAVKLASEVKNPLQQNIISVGRACNNEISKQLLGNPNSCTKGLSEGTGKIQLFNYNGKSQVVVQGYSDTDTRNAATLLSNYNRHSLSGTQVCTDSRSNVTNVISCEVPIEKCTDSDNGLDYFTKGKVSGPLSSDPSSPREDMCLGDTTLREMFCNSAGKGEPRLYGCTSGCKDGVCLKETPASICAMGGGFSCLDTNFDAQRNRVAIQVKNNLGYSARISEVKLSPGTSCQNENPVQKIDHVLGNGEVGLFLINCNAKGDIKESIQIIYTNVETGITHIASGKLYIKGSSTGPTCYDGIWNDGESGVDCGGSCKPCEETTCASGCMRNGKCLPFGTRVVEDNKALYCSIDGKFSMQKVENAECQNSYECETNTCSSAKCVDINRKLDEQQSTMQKILKWFSRIFGKE